jgi:hypothetical protein
MKAKILICTLVLMVSAFAGSAMAGTEGVKSTTYGLGTGNAAYDYNTFIGAGAGMTNTATFNTFIGYSAGRWNTTGNSNTFVGSDAGSVNSTAGGNTYVGLSAGQNNNGDANTIIGTYAGANTTSGAYNTFVGSDAGQNSNGTYNTFLGSTAGFYNSGTGNTFIGDYAGSVSYDGSYNVFLGNAAGKWETGSNKLYISNSSTSTPLIYGEFENSIVGINGKLGVGTQAPVRGVHLAGPNAVFRMDRSANTAAFQIVRTDGSGNPLKVFVVGVNASGTNDGEFIINDNGTALSGSLNRRMTIANDGTVTFTGNVFANNFNPSSLTLKDNVRTYENALDTVNRLRGVSFDWKDSGKPAVGLIAEEVAKVVPEVVAYNDGAAAGVNYASLVGVLVEAVKEQQAQHKAEIDSLKKEQQEAIKELQDKNN